MTAAATAGRHRAPRPTRLHRRLLDAWRARRQARAIEAGKDDAYAVRLKQHHEVPPLAAARVTADVMSAVLHAATGPLPAAMADVDDDRPWEFQTGQWPAYKEIIKGER